MDSLSLILNINTRHLGIFQLVLCTYLFVICLETVQFLSADELPKPYKIISRSQITGQQQIDELMERKMQFSFSDKTLRDISYQLQERTGMGCMIDARINPDQLLTLDTSFTSTTAIMDELVKGKQISWCKLGDLLIFTTPESTKLLPFLCFLKLEEFKQTKPDSVRLANWTKPQPWNWEILDQPRSIVSDITARMQTKISNPELLPHDLWAPGAAHYLSPIEQLQLVLMPYQLTCKWESSQNITLVPLDTLSTATVVIPLTKLEQKRMLASLEKNTKSTLKETVKGLQASGTLRDLSEVYEAHQQLQHPTKNGTNTDVKLAQRRFTLTVQDAKVGDILLTLKKGGILISYDEKDQEMSKRVSISVKNASIEELLKQLFQNTALTYQVDGETVRISVK